MNLRTIALGIVGVLICVVLIFLGFFIYSTSSSGSSPPPSEFSVLSSDVAGSEAYIVYNYWGSGNLTLLSSDLEPQKTVVVLSRSDSISDLSASKIYDQLKSLESYGYVISISNSSVLPRDSIVIVPTGAMPQNLLLQFQTRPKNVSLVYFGDPNLLISSGGTVRKNWFDSLNSSLKPQISVFSEDSFTNQNFSLPLFLLYQNWSLRNSKTLTLLSNKKDTSSLEFLGGRYLRVIYSFTDGKKGIYDSKQLRVVSPSISFDPSSIYPNEKTSLSFALNKSVGIPRISVSKEGSEIFTEALSPVTEENVVVKRLDFPDAGSYVVRVFDSSGVLYSGILHVNNLEVRHIGQNGIAYKFLILRDGVPLESSEVFVSLDNSTSPKKFYVSGGVLTVDAQLPKGKTSFNFQIGRQSVSVEVENNSEPLLDFYLKYGLPVGLIVLLVYLAARLSKSPSYRLRFVDSITYVRKEQPISSSEAITAFNNARKDMKLDSFPITPSEFSFGLKRHVTGGADVTDGNVEALLKDLVQKGLLQTYRNYYQLKTEGSVRQNVLLRLVREKLIENGISFQERLGVFVTPNYDLSFGNIKSSKKVLVVIEDKRDIHSAYSGLSSKETALLNLKIQNGLLSFVPIDELDDYL
ncbi:hypothetical protein HY990_03360 [Candidatus Micrarchaeota archaeon]|nr:hypothetical protein [Candidatus Micrarchaeota archaeon]